MEIPTAKNLKGYIRDNVETTSVIITDEFKSYKGLDKEFVKHEIINHSRKEYVRGTVHTNTAEGYFSLLKRGITGSFHHVSKHHLHRYLSEFDFRYNARQIKDEDRMRLAMKGIENKRLYFKKPKSV